MAIAKGTRLGAYEVLEPIGAGGMGEVYRATDSRIDRTVAIKVLPPSLADDETFKQRFAGEAKSIASLSHPHICTLYEFDSHDGTDFLVMELLEGESLTDRLARKGALPLEVACGYAIQIADALDSAHRRGIVHRDLKPGNIMLTRNGPKLLDFGLAKRTQEEPDDDAPTRAQPLTERGAILGTFQYMAPEQVEGKEADSRADVFAFGVVMYEMVTGKKAFEGGSRASLIGAILEREPEAMSTHQPRVPPALERIVKKCLAKAPEDRYHSMHDLADELRWIGDEPRSETTPALGGVLTHAMGFVVGALLAGLLISGLRPDSSAPAVARFSVGMDDPLSAPNTMTALAPDGSRFAYVAGGSIHVRELDRLDATPLPETEGDPRELAFSPDGEWIVYSDRRQLKKVAIASGAPLLLADVEPPLGLTWAADGFIYYGTFSPGVWRVPESGGAPELALSTLQSVWRPQLLPDGRTFLYQFGDGSAIALQSVEDDAPTVIFEGGVGEVRYLPSGHLMFAASNNLFAAPFDVSRMTLTGTPMPVVQDSDWQFDVAQNGTLLYLRALAMADRRLVWVDRNGAVTDAVDEKQSFRRPDLSDDGDRIAVQVSQGMDADIWVYELVRGTRTRLTTEAGSDRDPVWAPDGASIVFASSRNNVAGELFSMQADGSGEPELILTSDSAKDPYSFSPDGAKVAFYDRRGSDRDIRILDLETRKEEPFVVTEFNERSPSFSPDGRFIAYVSDASGQDEIYVQPYPGPGNRTVVSTDGGYGPVWRRDGKELFYRNGDRMMAVEVRTDTSPGELSASAPQILFEGSFVSEPSGGSGSRTYDVSAYGQRFLMIDGGDTGRELLIVLNWLEELEARVPGAR